MTGQVSSHDAELAKEFSEELAKSLSHRRFTIRLYGSRARGDAEPESELDLFVGLEDDDPDESIKTIARNVACEFTLRYGILFSVFVADRRFMQEHRGYSFLEMVEREGIQV